ncbi:MAG: hypothetical protein JWM44_4474 [Bacilli bacterium]|nr:hypothetical protein [Bacilli bacterium]
MVYFKTVLDDRKVKSDNYYPIVVRVTFNRKVTTFTTGVRIQKEFWDDKLHQIKTDHPNCAMLNANVLEFSLKIQKASLLLESENNFSFEQLKERLNNNVKTTKITKVVYFNEFAQTLINSTFEANKAGTAMAYQVATKRLMGFANNPKLKFIDIDYLFLESFRKQLVKDGLKPNAISTYFRSCRAIYNKAIKAKLVDRSHYAFIDVPVKTERTTKRAITPSDLKKISDVELEVNTPIWHYRNYFILSFTLRGISFSDLAYLEPSNIIKGRLIYKRKKTGQEINIKLLPLASQILGVL